MQSMDAAQVSAVRKMRAAQSHWAQWLPQRYATIKNPDEFFELLGTEIAREIESQTSARLRNEPETLPPEKRPGWRNMARLMTEDAVLAEMAFLTPEPDPDEPGTPGTRPDDRSVEPPQGCPEAMQAWDFGYAQAMEWRLLHGDPHGPGMAGVWGRPRIPLVQGEETSGLCRTVLVADSGNGVSASLDWDRWSFVNVDLSVHLCRPVEGEWVLLDAASRISTTGSGLATSVLRDQVGVLGAGAQTLVITPRTDAR